MKQIAPRVWLRELGAATPGGGSAASPPSAALADGALALPDDALALPYVASAAFGDGTHPTTRLCAGAVDVLSRGDALGAVLDVGTGSGVLARIARARGACFVAATDIDAAALAAAARNFALDRAPVDLQNAPPDHWGARFALVVANLLEAPLRELAPALARALAPGGTLLTSGYLRPQSPALCTRFGALGLRHEGDSILDGWVLGRFSSAIARDAAPAA